MAERFEIVQKALLAMLEDKKYATLRDILITMNPSDIAGLFVDMEDKQIPLMFRLLPKELAAQTCEDLGEKSLALKVEMAGKLCIFGVVAPVLLELLETIVGLVP